MNNKGLLIFFVYELLYWILWLGFIYVIVKLSNSFGYLWLLIIPCIMSKTINTGKEDEESEVDESNSKM